jgi:hypothetical protein
MSQKTSIFCVTVSERRIVNTLLQTTRLYIGLNLRLLIDLVRTAAKSRYTYLAAHYFQVSRFGLNIKPDRLKVLFSFFFWLYNPIQTLSASMKLSVSLQLLDLRQSVGLPGRGFEPTVPASEPRHNVLIRIKTLYVCFKQLTIHDSS